MPEILFGYRLRRAQDEVMRYEGGRMAISAVPGSGKTLTLALLAAKLIIEGRVGPASEVLVVTVQNSAVDNISQRIRRILAEQKMPPVGYRVCTLHKLASDILRRRMDLAGVSDELVIVDEAESDRMMRNAAEVWRLQHSALWSSFLPTDWHGDRSRVESDWLEETVRIGREVTKLCKHLRFTPEGAQSFLEEHLPDAEMTRLGVALYAHYDRTMRGRGGLDFDDLIWRAIDALEQDPSFAANLRTRWPYILEDEAQDSSPLQENILRILCGQDGNWVRMGDPNQAINATFTAADPRFFRQFLEEEGVRRLNLPESGRCARPILEMANALVRWVTREHPERPIRAMAFEPQEMIPTTPEDPQQNPPAEECHIYFREEPFEKVEEEAHFVARAAASYIKRHPHHAVAILCPAAWQGAKVVEEFKRLHNVPYEDLLRTTPEARNVARLLAAACRYLGDPTKQRPLAALFRELAEANCLGEVAKNRLKSLLSFLRSAMLPEFLFPKVTVMLSERLPANVPLLPEDEVPLGRFTALVSRWLRAAELPIDQLLLTIGQDLFGERDEDLGALAICHTIALSMRTLAQLHPEMRLREYAGELEAIAQNRRTLQELALPDAAYLTKPGIIVVTTMHKAKGLEWDAVYLMCVDSLEFPATIEDPSRDEPYYMPGRAPALEARMYLERAAGERLRDTAEDVIAQGRLETIAERLRLLYVAITRARRNLAFTWSRRNGNRLVGPALAMEALRTMAEMPSDGEEPWR